MAKVLITGGAGFIGSRVAHKFIQMGHETIVYDAFRQYHLDRSATVQQNLLVRLSGILDQVEIVHGDTLDKYFLHRTLNRIRPDIVVHMAALPLAERAIEYTEDAFESILNGTVNILEVLRDLNQNCVLLYTSSSMVYGDFREKQVTEQSATDPKEIYGSLKLAGEIIARGYMRRYGIDVRVVRPTAVYGPYDANQRVLYKFVTRALNEEKLIVHGDGSMPLDFTFVEDTANGIYLAATKPRGARQVFNIARGEAKTLNDAIDIISDHVGGTEIEYRPVPDHVPNRGTLDVSKARKMIGFSPEYNLELGLGNYISHLRQNKI